MTKRAEPSRSRRGADLILAGVCLLCVGAGVALAVGAGAPRAPGVEGAVYFPALLGAGAGASALLIARVLRFALGRRCDGDDDLHSR